MKGKAFCTHLPTLSIVLPYPWPNDVSRKDLEVANDGEVAKENLAKLQCN